MYVKTSKVHCVCNFFYSLIVDKEDPFMKKLEINGSEQKTLWNIEWFESA